MRRFLSVLVLALVIVAGVSVVRAGDITAIGIYQRDLYTFLSNVVTMANEIKSDVTTDQSHSKNMCLGHANVASNGTTLQVEAFNFAINGLTYNHASAAESLTAAAQATSTHRLYLFSINAGGTATCTAGTAASTFAAMAMPTLPSSHAPFGYLYIQSGNVTNFTLGTTAFGVASTTRFHSVTFLASDSTTISTSDLSLTGL